MKRSIIITTILTIAIATQAFAAGPGGARVNGTADTTVAQNDVDYQAEVTKEAPSDGPMTPVPNPTGPKTNVSDETTMAQQAITLINAKRRAVGMKELILNDKLTVAAHIRAQELCTLYSHVRPSGESWSTALDDVNYYYSHAGENIAAGDFTPVEVVEAWYESEGHKKNMLDISFEECGLYVCRDASDRLYWANEFGTRL